MKTTLANTALCVAALALAAPAQSFDYPDFSSTAGLVTLGNAAVSGTAMRLTPSALSQKGVVWYSTPVAVAGGFDTTFQYQISSSVSGGADGFAFVIQNDPRGTTFLGKHASALGYGGFATDPAGTAVGNALVIEIDTYGAGSPWFDPDGNHFSVHVNGTGDVGAFEALSIGRWSNTAIGSGTHDVRFQYVPGALSLYFDDLVTPKLTIPYSFATGGTWLAGGAVGGLNLIGGSSAYVGITAATGGVYEVHDINSWSWSSAAGIASYCTAGTSTNGCLPAISGSGTPSASATSGFTIDVTNLEGQQSGLIFYGVNGRVANAWGLSSSFFCVKAPVERTGVQNSGGTFGACDGAFSVDWLAFVAGYPGALGSPFSAGDMVNAQGWYRDPPSPKTTMLSDALEFTLVP